MFPRVILALKIIAELTAVEGRILNTVEPRYPDTLRTRKKCRHKRSVAVTGVGETYVYKKLYFS